MASVSYRKRKGNWQIRFRAQGEKEIVKILPGSLREATVADKVTWYKEQMALDRLDPWEQERIRAEQERLGLLISSALDEYINHGVESGKWKTDHKGFSRTAHTNKERIGYLIEEVGNIPLSDLTGQLVNSYIQGLSVSAYSKRSYLSSINSFMRWLYDTGRKDRLEQGSLPHATRQRVKQVEKATRGITIYQLRRLLVGIRQYDRAVRADNYATHHSDISWGVSAFAMAFAAMLRRSEIIKIYPVDVARDYSELTVGNFKQPYRPEFIPKGGISTIPTTALMRKVLQAMDVHSMDPDRPIIDRSASSLRRVWSQAQERAGIKARIHDLRHGGVMYYRSKGWPESLVSKLARHASSNTTAAMYGGTDTSELKRTLERYDK